MLGPADKLTLSRVAATPFLIAMLHFEAHVSGFLTLGVFVLACLTDLFDGMVARRTGKVTNFGKILDPLADKILIGSVMIMLVHVDRLPGWAVALVLTRETAVTGLRAAAADFGFVMAADRLGKLKTVLQIASLCLLIPAEKEFGFGAHFPGLVLFYVAMVAALYSGWNYLYGFYKKCLL